MEYFHYHTVTTKFLSTLSCTVLAPGFSQLTLFHNILPHMTIFGILYFEKYVSLLFRDNIQRELKQLKTSWSKSLPSDITETVFLWVIFWHQIIIMENKQTLVRALDVISNRKAICNTVLELSYFKDN